MRFRLAVGFAAVTLAIASAPARVPRNSELRVVTSGSEEALALGKTTLSRPFGALLVDHLRIVGAYRSVGELYYLVEGTAGATCPARYLIVTPRAGQSPAISAPFGTCGMGATVRRDARGLIISVAPGPTDRQPVRYFYGRAGLRQIDMPRTAGAILRRCPTAPAQLGSNAGLTAELDRIFPPDYRTASGIRHAQIGPDQLREMLAHMACLAADPDAEPVIPKAATALFVSKRYGETSFAILDDLASAPASDPQLRASARTFAATMHYYVARHEPL